MKVLSVKEAAPQLGKLVTDALNGEAIFLRDGVDEVQLMPQLSSAPPFDFNSEEFKAELLRGMEGPHKPYSDEEMKKACHEALKSKKRA